MKQTYPSHMKEQLKKTIKNLLLVSFLLIISTSRAQTTLKEAADAKGKYIGTILNVNFFNRSGNETQYEPTILTEFNAVVAENNHKMSFLIPNEPTNPDGSFNWNFTIDDLDRAAIDNMANFGGNDVVLRRGHALIWYNEVPNWLLNKTTNASGGNAWTKQEIYDFSEQYITVLVNYTKGKFDEWDLFNEAISDDNPANFRRGTWYDGVGPTDQDIQDYIDFCFTVANTVDANNEIDFFYNDYSIEFFNSNATSKNGFMRSMISNMISRGIPIDGVGLQSHFVSNNGFDANSVGATMDFIGNLKSGMICNITELDFRICNNGMTPTAAELSTQADNYERILEVAMDNNASTGLIFWGFTDQHTWIPNFAPSDFAGCNSPLLFDASYVKKPAYTGALNGALRIPLPPPEPGVQSPFNGSPFVISSASNTVIPFYEFDNGGQDVAYNDTTTGQENNGTTRPDEDVEIYGTIVGNTNDGEWLEYTINVQNAGNYNVGILTTSEQEGIGSISIDGVNVSGAINFPNTGSFSTNYMTTNTTIPLQVGEQVLRFTIDQAAFNLDTMTFSFDTPLSTTAFTAADNLQLYPVPFDNVMNISFKGIENVKTFQLVDVLGKQVYEQYYAGGTSVQLQPSGLNAGLYFIKTIFKNNDVKFIRVVQK